MPKSTPTYACPQRPEILTLKMFAGVVGLRGKNPERAARDFIRRHGVPHVELRRESWFVLHSSLVAWLRDQEEPLTLPDVDAIVAEMVAEDQARIEDAVNRARRGR